MLKCDTDGSRPLYRPRGWNRDERVKEKRAKKVEWYKHGGYESVVFVPATPKSALQKTFKEALRDSGLRVRVVERAGHTVKNFLQRSNPFQTPTCVKMEDCFVCSTGGKGSCRAMVSPTRYFAYRVAACLPLVDIYILGRQLVMRTPVVESICPCLRI